MKPDEDDENFTLYQSGIFGPQKQASRLLTRYHPGLGLSMGYVFRRHSGIFYFLGGNTRSYGNKRKPAHAKLYQPCELWVLKLFRAPCHPSSYPELILMCMWNCWFRDPKQLLWWGGSASEGREGSTAGLQLFVVVVNVTAASLCWGYQFIYASGTTWKSWILFQAQGSICAMQWGCIS